MINLIKNGSFEQAWQDRLDAVNQTNQVPAHWELFVYRGNGRVVPECVHKLQHQLPPDEHPGGENALILDGSACYKIFAASGKFEASLSQTIQTEPSSVYKLIAPVQVHWHPRNGQTIEDMNPAYANMHVFINDTKVETCNGIDRTWQYATYSFVATGHETEITLEFNSLRSDGVGVDFFIDNVQLYRVDEPDTPPAPPSGSAFAYYQFAGFVNPSEAANLIGPGGIVVPIQISEPGGNGGEVIDFAYEPFSQNDPRWAHARIGNSSETIGNYGCLVTVFATIANAFIRPITPDELNQQFLRAGAYIGANTRWNALSMVYPAMRFIEVFPTHGGRAKLDRYLDDGSIVVARVDADPATMAWEQHWVLITGREGDDYTIINPWRGSREYLTDYYDRQGYDIHTALVYARPTDSPFDRPPTPSHAIDLLPYIMTENRRRYRVTTISGAHAGAEEIFWTQQTGHQQLTFWKNNQWEQWLYDDRYIRLWRDNSPAPQDDGRARWYEVTAADGQPGGRWCLRRMLVGQTFDEASVGGHHVQFYAKDNNEPLAQNSGNSSNSTTLLEQMEQWKSPHGPILNDCIRIGKPGGEVHVFAKDIGRVAWTSPWGASAFKEWV